MRFNSDMISINSLKEQPAIHGAFQHHIFAIMIAPFVGASAKESMYIAFGITFVHLIPGEEEKE